MAIKCRTNDLFKGRGRKCMEFLSSEVPFLNKSIWCDKEHNIMILQEMSVISRSWWIKLNGIMHRMWDIKGFILRKRNLADEGIGLDFSCF